MPLKLLDTILLLDVLTAAPIKWNLQAALEGQAAQTDEYMTWE